LERGDEIIPDGKTWKAKNFFLSDLQGISLQGGA